MNRSDGISITIQRHNVLLEPELFIIIAIFLSHANAYSFCCRYKHRFPSCLSLSTQKCTALQTQQSRDAGKHSSSHTFVGAAAFFPSSSCSQSLHTCSLCLFLDPETNPISGSLHPDNPHINISVSQDNLIYLSVFFLCFKVLNQHFIRSNNFTFQFTR